MDHLIDQLGHLGVTGLVQMDAVHLAGLDILGRVDELHAQLVGHDAQVLPPKEFNLLYKLLAYPERTFTRLELLDEIWGMDSESDDKTVNVHINRLRTRFYDWPEFEIQTIRGIGYRAIKKV